MSKKEKGTIDVNNQYADNLKDDEKLFGSDDNFNFDDFDDRKVSNQSNTRKLLNSALGAAAEEAINPNTWNEQILSKVLPKDYGEILSTTDEYSSTFTELFEEASTTIKPAAYRLASIVNKLVPGESNRLKKLTSSIKEKLSPDQSYGGTDESKVREDSLIAGLSEVFGQQQATSNIVHAEERAENKVKTRIDFKFKQDQSSLLASMDANLSRISQYTTSINAAYQRKSLELQYRSYFVQSDLLNTTKEFYKTFAVQNKDIIKNTGLPDYLKITIAEMSKEQGIRNVITMAQKSLFGEGSSVQRAGQRIKKKAKESARRVREAFESGIAMGEGVETAIESGGDLSDTTGSIAGSLSAVYLAGKLGDKLHNLNILKKVDEYTPEWKLGSRTKQVLFKTNNILKNPSGWAKRTMDSGILQEDYGDSVIKGGLKSLGRNILESFVDKSDSNALATGNMMDVLKPAVFDNMTRKSIVNIIPTYLSHILREIKVLRTKDESTEFLTYDHKKEELSEASEVQKSIREELIDKIGIKGSKNERKGIYRSLKDRSGKMVSKKDPITGKILKDAEGKPIMVESFSVPEKDHFTEEEEEVISYAVSKLQTHRKGNLFTSIPDLIKKPSRNNFGNNGIRPDEGRRIIIAELKNKGYSNEQIKAFFKKFRSNFGESDSGLNVNVNDEAMNRQRIFNDSMTSSGNSLSVPSQFLAVLREMGQLKFATSLNLFEKDKDNNIKMNFENLARIISGSTDVSDGIVKESNTSNSSPSSSSPVNEQKPILERILDSINKIREVVEKCACDKFLMNKTFDSSIKDIPKEEIEKNKNKSKRRKIKKGHRSEVESPASNLPEVTSKDQNVTKNNKPNAIQQIKDFILNRPGSSSLGFSGGGFIIPKGKQLEVKDGGFDPSDLKQITERLRADKSKVPNTKVESAKRLLTSLGVMGGSMFIPGLANAGETSSGGLAGGLLETLGSYGLDFATGLPILSALRAGSSALGMVTGKDYLKEGTDKLKNKVSEFWKKRFVKEDGSTKTAKAVLQENVGKLKENIKERFSEGSSALRMTTGKDYLKEGTDKLKNKVSEFWKKRFVKEDGSTKTAKAVLQENTNKLKENIKERFSEGSSLLSKKINTFINKDKVYKDIDKIPEGRLGRGLDKLKNKLGAYVYNDAMQDISRVNERKSVNLLQKLADYLKPKKTFFNDSDGDGDREGNWKDRLKNKLFKRKETDESKKDNVKPKKSLFGLLSGIFSVLGTISTGIFKLPALLSAGLGLILNKSLGTLLEKIPLGGVLKGAGTLVKGALKVAKGVGGLLLKGLKKVSPKLLIRGVGLFNPVGIAATVGYAAYKGYQYYSNGKLEHPLEYGRMLQYGANPQEASHLRIIHNLEKHLFDKAVTITEKDVIVDQKKIDRDEIFNSFGKDPEDKDFAEILNIWFNKRFYPVFNKHIKSLHETNPKTKDFSYLKKLTNKEISTYLDKVKFIKNTANITTSPFDGQETITVTEDQIKNWYDTKIVEYQTKASKDSSKKNASPEDKPVPKLVDTKSSNLLKSEAQKMREKKEQASKTNVSVTTPAIALSTVVNPSPYILGGYKDQNAQSGNLEINKTYKPVKQDAKKNEALLEKAAKAAGITDIKELAMFMAQMSHESGGFKYMVEQGELAGSAYEGRASLGNNKPGDGIKYKGRGFIQITGRWNYTFYGKRLGIDLVNHPELAEDPENAAKIAVAYWIVKKAGEPARAGDVKQTTYLINGGYNGLADRIERYKYYYDFYSKNGNLSAEYEKNPAVPEAFKGAENNLKGTPTANTAPQSTLPKTLDIKGSQQTSSPLINVPSNISSNPKEGGSSSIGDYAIPKDGVNVSDLNGALKDKIKSLTDDYGKTTGESLVITSGYRSVEEQKQLYSKNPDIAAPPGKSLHNFGLAFDADSRTLNKMNGLGLLDKYGLVRPIQGEPWHVEPTGVRENKEALINNPDKATKAIKETNKNTAPVENDTIDDSVKEVPTQETKVANSKIKPEVSVNTPIPKPLVVNPGASDSQSVSPKGNQLESYKVIKDDLKDINSVLNKQYDVQTRILEAIKSMHEHAKSSKNDSGAEPISGKKSAPRNSTSPLAPPVIPMTRNNF